MAIELLQGQESVTGGEAVAIFRDILGDPDLKENAFYNLVSDGKITAIPNKKERGKQRYPREVVVRLAEERLKDLEEIKDLLTLKQVEERIQARGIPLKIRELKGIADSGRLPTWRRYGYQRYYRPEDVDAVIASLLDIRVLREQTRNLMETMDAVRYINDCLEARGRTDRLELNAIYKHVEREVIIPDMIIPAGARNKAVRFYWSKATLEKHPIFDVPDAMPGADEVEAVRVTGTKVLRRLEEEWGELANRHGIREDGLSVHFVNKKDRTIAPVGYDGSTQWFPVKYIPKKLRRRPNDLKEIKDMLSED